MIEFGDNEDIFLKLDLARSGAVKGESDDSTHKDEIVLTGWSWGITASSAMGAGGPATKATIQTLRLTKNFDRSSPVLMSAVRNNDSVKKAVLTMRKAGGGQQEYLKITIEKGRVTDYEVSTEGPRAVERFVFSFKKIDVEYRQQSADGQLGGGVSFSDEIE